MYSHRQEPPQNYDEPTTTADMLEIHGSALDAECHEHDCHEQVYRLAGSETCLDGHKQRDVPTHE